MIALELPWPPTINTYYARTPKGVFLRKRGREFRSQVQLLLMAQGIRRPLSGELRMWVRLYPPRKNYDMDNLLKALWDALQHGGAYINDRQIKFLILEDTGITGDFIEVFIEPRVNNDTPAFCKPQAD